MCMLLCMPVHVHAGRMPRLTVHLHVHGMCMCMVCACAWYVGEHLVQWHGSDTAYILPFIALHLPLIALHLPFIALHEHALLQCIKWILALSMYGARVMDVVQGESGSVSPTKVVSSFAHLDNHLDSYTHTHTHAYPHGIHMHAQVEWQSTIASHLDGWPRRRRRQQPGSRLRSTEGSKAHASCAVVGSAAALLTRNLGAEIDAHETVIRTNQAPTVSYEAYVGSRTDLRIWGFIPLPREKVTMRP